MDEMTEALLWGMLNWTAVGPDGLPAQILKIDHPAFAQYFHDILVNVRVAGEVPQHWKDAHHQGPSHIRTELIATTTIEGVRLLPTQAKCC